MSYAQRNTVSKSSDVLRPTQHRKKPRSWKTDSRRDDVNVKLAIICTKLKRAVEVQERERGGGGGGGAREGRGGGGGGDRART